MLASALLIFSIPKPVQRTETDKPTLDTLFAGFRYIWSEKVVLGAISLDLFAVLLSGAVALLPVYARDILELGPWGLGLLRAAPGIGAIIVAVWLTGHPIKSHAGVMMLIAVVLWGAITVVFGVSTISWLSIFALAMLGATDMVSVYVRETLIQLWTPDNAWTRQRREHGVRRRVQRTRRVPRRHDGGIDRPGRGGGRGRHRRDRRGRPLGLGVSGAQEGATP
jgi:MFS family permease